MADQNSLSRLNQLINDNPVIIFSKTQCPYCVKVKELFHQLNVTYRSVELDLEPDGNGMHAVLSDKIGRKTVPQVFVGGDLIGGCDDTFKAHEDGVLGELLLSLNLIAK